MSTTATETDWIAGHWTIDPSHTSVGFTVRHLVSKVRGQFTKFEGSVTTGENVADTQAEATIDLTSVDTRDENRDNHLRSSDFFDVENHGHMSWKTTSFDGEKAVGELTIRGITKPVTLDVEVLGIGDDPWGGKRIGFEATGEINRHDFNVSFNGVVDGSKVLVGDKVTIHLNVEAVLDQPQADA